MPAPWNAHAVVRVIGEIHGQTTNNVMHFATNANISDNDGSTLMLQLLAALVACIETTLLPAVTADWNFTAAVGQYVGTVIPTVTTDPFVQGPAGSGQGQLGATSVSFSASLAHVRSGIGGRRGRGRMFLPPPGEAQVAASVMDDPTLDLVIAYLTCVAGKFLGVGATTDWRFGVYSRKIGQNNFNNFNNAFFEAKQLTASNTLAVIGRRKKGRGD